MTKEELSRAVAYAGIGLIGTAIAVETFTWLLQRRTEKGPVLRVSVEHRLPDNQMDIIKSLGDQITNQGIKIRGPFGD
jgi:hypothetical protein